MSSCFEPRVIVALDYADESGALALAARLDPTQCRLKVGKELFTAAGPRVVQQLVDRGFGVFLDLKFHDIPTTVASACRAAARLGIWMLNVHASGGRAMLRAARDAIPANAHSPKLVAVTLLTSMAASDLPEIGVSGTPEEAVVRLALLARECALDGVVCSALEAALLRRNCGSSFCLVTPGIRPANGIADDQQRVTTPAAAIAAGASYLVVGRPITSAPDPLAALARITDEVASMMRPL